MNKDEAIQKAIDLLYPTHNCYPEIPKIAHAGMYTCKCGMMWHYNYWEGPEEYGYEWVSSKFDVNKAREILNSLIQEVDNV